SPSRLPGASAGRRAKAPQAPARSAVRRAWPRRPAYDCLDAGEGRRARLRHVCRARSWLTATQSSSVAGSTRWRALRCSLAPDGEAAFLLRSADANAEELDRHAAGDGAAWRRLLDSFLPNADLAFGVLGTELWSRDGLALALKAYRRLGRGGLVEFTGNVLAS